MYNTRMRYTVWGPVIGLLVLAVALLLNLFGPNLSSYIIAGVAFVLIGLIAGLVMDYKK